MKNFADSAGQPWAGRRLHPHTFAADDGLAPAELSEVLQRFQSAECTQSEVISVVREVRLLVPLVSHAAVVEEGEQGIRRDKVQEISVVYVSAPDGRKVLPVFSSTESMAAWNVAARPVPVPCRQIALAAVAEEAELVVLDPASETSFAIRRPALWAIAQEEPWLSPCADAPVAAEFEATVRNEPHVRSLALSEGDPHAALTAAEVVVSLELLPGLSVRDRDALLHRLRLRWSSNEVIAHRVDSISLTLWGGEKVSSTHGASNASSA